MPKFPNAHLVLNSRDRTLTGNSGSYNNFILRNPGQNIVQGAMKDVAFSEVYFPYDIPKVQEGFNTFTITDVSGGTSTPGASAEVDVPGGFYTGEELRAAVEEGFLLAARDIFPDISSVYVPTCTYDAVSNRYALVAPVEEGYAWLITSPFTYNPDLIPTNTRAPSIGKDLLSIMGFSQVIEFVGGSVVAQLPVLEGGQIFSTVDGGSAPLTFTDYIDICSPALCQYQYLRDGSTTNFPRRVDLICRLYISNETSTAFEEPVGTRPFIIHRQFRNQRVMKNTAANAINDVDIQLYDDCGQPLLTTYTPRNFQITFHVYEADPREAESNIGYKY